MLLKILRKINIAPLNSNTVSVHVFVHLVKLCYNNHIQVST